MKLNVQERLIMLGIIPEKGNFETMSTIENLKKILVLTEEEVTKFELKQDASSITWNKAGAEAVEVKLSIKGKALLLDALEKLDQEAALTADHYLIFKKFKNN